MRSDKDKRTETEKEIDDFLSKFEVPAEKSSADFSTYLEPEEPGRSNGTSFIWKDEASDENLDEFFAFSKKSGSSDTAPGPEIEPDEKTDFKEKSDNKDEAKEDTDKKPGAVKEPASDYKVGKKKRRKNNYRKTSPASEPEIRAEDEIKPETPASKEEFDKADIKEDVKEKSDTEPEANKGSAAVVKTDRKKRRNKDYRNTSPVQVSEKKSDTIEDSKAQEKQSDASVSDKTEAIEDVVSAALVPGAGAEMSKYGNNRNNSGKKRSRRKKKKAADTDSAGRKVIKDTGKAFESEKVVDENIHEREVIKDSDKASVTDSTDKKEDAKVEKHVETKEEKKSEKPALKADRKKKSEREVIKDTKEVKDDKSGNALTRFKRKKSDVKKPDKKVRKNVVFKNSSGLLDTLKKRKGERTLGEFLFLKPNPDYDPSKGDTYEKDGKTVKNKKNKLSLLKILGNIAAVCMVFVLAGMIYAIACIASAPKYDYKDIYSAVDTASVVYDDQGSPIDNVFYTENRKVIKYEDMPEDLVNSFIAIEDKTFWKHHGFNWTRMIGAIISSLTGNGKISGTSTITQQLARNVYLADTKSVRSIKRKLLEMYYASRLEHNLSKEEIVEAYLNTIYLGHGCYGVNSAARTYFSKDVKDLDLIECAALAALPQSPDTYALLKLQSEAQDAVDPKIVVTEPDTIVTNDIAKGRRQLTLDLMLDQGMISKAYYDKVYDLSLNDFINPTINTSGSIYSYFHEYLVDTVINDLVEQQKMTYEDAERMVYTRGLQIYSTVDSTAQKVIVDEFNDDSNFPYVDPPRDEDGNMLNGEGEIAMYKFENDFDENGNFRLSGENGDVSVNGDGSVTVNKGKKLHIYETETTEGTDYSLEFKSYYLYDDEDNLYSISGGYVNIPMGYKSLDSGGNVVISADYFSDPTYSANVDIDGKDVVFKPGSYSLSTKSRQPQAAMTIVGVGTGEVKAMVGGRTSGGQKLLNRSLNPRQPGSSIKPLAVYGAALQKSYDLHEDGKKWKFTDFGIDKQGTKGWGDYITCYSSVEDERLRVEGRYWPNNFSNSFSGKNNFITAIQHSINTCAVKILLQVGADYSVEQLKKFGLTTVQDDTSNPVNDVNPAALALGAMCEGVEPLEMALAYAAFPGGGKVNTPICYYKVLDRNGEVLLEGKSEQTEALNEGVAWIMTNVLQSVVSSNGYMYVEGVSPGGKTGTTNDEYDIWFDGFTPSYAGALWIGTDENVDMNTTSTPAARLWGKIMNQIPAAKTGEYKEQPSNVIRTSGCYFTEGTETGRTSWSDEEARKKAMEKAKQAAYEKWLKERESHKKLVPAKTQEVDDTTRPIYGDVLVGYEQIEQQVQVPRIDPNTGKQVVDEQGKPVFDTVTQLVDDPSRPIYQQGIIGYEKKTVVVEKEHYEYEEGWRDGDFKFDESDYE